MIYISDISQLNCADLEKMVCEERIRYASKYKFEIDRRRSLAVEALLNYALKEEGYEGELPVRVGHHENWAPYFLDEVKLPGADKVYFSLSHSGDYVAVALDTYPIGIDIEEIKPHKENIEQKFFTEHERNLIDTDEDGKEAGFFKIWTLKEAFLKAVGEGLRFGIEEVNVEVVNIAERRYKFNISGFYGMNIFAPSDYAMSICSSSHEKKYLCSYIALK